MAVLDMSNTNNLDTSGFEVKGNLTVIGDDCNGNGSVEVSGTIYTDIILKYSTSTPGLSLEQTIFDNGRRCADAFAIID